MSDRPSEHAGTGSGAGAKGTGSMSDRPSEHPGPGPGSANPGTAGGATGDTGTGACVDSLDVEVYTVPTDQPEADATIAWEATTVVVARACGGGMEGLGWTYAGAGCEAVVTGQLRGAVVGTPLTDVPAMSDAMIRACRNLGRPGIVSSAISAVDTALWDLKARVLRLPLCRLFGKCRESAPIYGSGGFTTYSDERTTAQLEQWVGDWGIGRVKIKIGESWGQCQPRPRARGARPFGHRRRLRAVRRRQRGLHAKAGDPGRATADRAVGSGVVRGAGVVR